MLNDTKGFKILGALSVVALVAVFGQAAHAQFAVAKCTEISEPGGSAAEIAQVCGRFVEAAVAEPFNGAEKGFAFFHAANASARLNNPVAAADLVTRSYTNLVDDSSSLALSPIGERPKSRSKAKKWDAENAENAKKSAFKFNRTMLKASNLRLLGEQFASGQVSPSDTSQCSDKTSCVDAAINFLNAQSGVIRPYLATATTPEGPQVDSFHFLKAELIEARNRGSDKADALAAYKAVMAGNSGSSEEYRARAKIEALGIELGDAARSGKPGPVTEQALSEAVGFYDKAIEANAVSLPALLGKGRANLDRASLTSVLDASRRAYYGEAVSAFDAASRAVPAGSAGYAAAAYELGSAKTAWANYLGTPPSMTPSDKVKHDALRREAVTNFEAAVAASPSEAPYLRGLATAYKANGETPKAVVAYRKAIAALLGSSAGAAWDVPHTEADRAAFRSRVTSLPVADRKFISAALLDLGDTAGESIDLLLAAKEAYKGSVTPSLRLAKLYKNSSAGRAEIAYVLTESEQSAGVVRPGMEADRAEAYFLRSTFASESTPTVAAIEDADKAVQLQPANAGYSNWACMVRIKRGDDYVKGANTASGCSGLIGDEREVMRGMFLLRAAQAAPASQKQGFRNQAQMVFIQGDARLGQTPDYETKSGDFPWWAGDPEALKLRPLLLYGAASAIACSGSDIRPDLTATEIAHARSYYVKYQANGC